MESTNNLEHYLIESAYYSELWAVYDIQSKIQNEGWDFFQGSKLEHFHRQLQDEKRHVCMLRQAMKDEGYTPRDDTLKYSMQNVIFKYAGHFDLAKTRNSDIFMFFHETMEKRAIWIYRHYLLFGTIERYKTVLAAIIKEERDHLHNFKCDHAHAETLVDVDKHLFNHTLPERYGKNLIQSNPRFWSDYYGSGLNI